MLMKRNLQSAALQSSGLGLKLFSENDMEHLHSAVLEILSTIGVHFESKEALDCLADTGAVVDYETGIVKLPEYMVNDAIASAPSQFILAGKEPQYDYILGDGRVNFIPFGTGILIEDLETRQIRKTTKADIADCARIIDALDDYDLCMETVVAQDVPPKVEALHNFAAHLSNTKKNVTAGPSDKRTAEAIVEMAVAYAGSLEALQERPLLNLGGCTISPLTIPESTCQALMVGARNKIPVGCLSMAMSGGMSPVTLAGTLAVTFAEVLAGLVLSQTVRKGAPVMIGTSAGTLDHRHNAAAMVGCPELALISAGFAQLCHHLYNIPSLVAGT